MKVPIHKLKRVKVIAYRTVALSVLIRKAKASRPVRIVREVFALLSLLRLRRETYAWQKYRTTSVYRSVKGVRELTPGKVARAGFGFTMKASAMAAIAVLVLVPGLQAFEAHIVNVTAEPAFIDPPFLTPPGDNDPTNLNGGGPYTNPIDIEFDNEDPDGSHIYYTFGPGTDPGTVPDPVCGQVGPNGGGDAEIPIELVQLNLTSDTVVKAITCDGTDGTAHFSLINTKIYLFEDQCQDRFAPLDVMIIFDRSGSMDDDPGDEPISTAKQAAKTFIDFLDPASDQVGLVSYADTATLNEQLQTTFNDVKTAIDGLTASGATNIGDGIAKGNDELSSVRARANSTKIMILLTDGIPNRPGSGDNNATALALIDTEVAEAVSKGFIIFTIGLGSSLNEPLLQDIADDTGGEYFNSPTANELEAIYEEIALLLCGDSKISGYKFEDENQDGIRGITEPPISGWMMTLKVGNGIFGSVFTNGSGYYEFDDLPAGTFKIVEENRAGWIPTNPATGSTTVTILVDGDEISDVNFGNYDTGMQCVPLDVDFPANLAVLAAGSDGDNDQVRLEASVVVNGDVRSNSDIEDESGGSTDPLINGDAIAVSTVDDSIDYGLGGGETEGAAATTLPDISIATWQDRADDGGTVNGSIEIPDGTSGVELGPSRIIGNLVIGNGSSVTIKGPLYIEENLVIEPNVTITQDPAFGFQLVAIIVDGTVDIDDDVIFDGAGSGATEGVILLVSTAAEQSGTNAAIEVSADTTGTLDLGDLVLYASTGDVHIGTNRGVLAIFAVDGTSSSDPAIDLDSGVDVNYRALPPEIACGPRFTPIGQLLINEFVPALSGSDTGTPGGALDGEWVELYNGSNAPIDVSGYVLYDDVVPPTSSPTSKTWTSGADFTPGILTNTIIETSGDDRVRVANGQTSGTFEIVLDVGVDKKGDWQSFDWSENLDSGANICVELATSDDNIVYTAFTVPDCSPSSSSLTGLADSRYLKWKSTHTRTSGSSSNDADLEDLTVDYNLLDFADYHELVISVANTDTGSTIIPAGGFLVVFRDGDDDFAIDNGESGNDTDTVKLYDGFQPAATLIDSHGYSYPGTIPDDKSVTRMPDGTANWVDPEPTPGEPNDEFIDPDTTPTEQIVFEPLPEEQQEEVILPPQPGESDYDEEEELSLAEEQTNGSTDEETASASSDGQATGDEQIICEILEDAGELDSGSESGMTEEGETVQGETGELMNEETESSFASDEATEGLAEQGDLSSDSSPSPGEEEVVVECVAQDEESSSAEATEGLTEEQSEETPQETTDEESSSAEASDGQQEAILTNVQIKPDDEPADNPDGDTPPPPDPEPTISEGLFGETLSTNSVDSVLPPASE